MTRLRGAGLAGGIVAAVLLISGCTGTTTAAPPATSQAAVVTPTPTPTPTPTVTAPAVEKPLSKTVDAGTVAAAVTATASGTGSSNVTYKRNGDFAVVVELNCLGCAGTATVTAPGRLSPFGQAEAPLRASFLMDVFKDDPVSQTLIVKATGPWKVTLRSWNDLTPVSGKQSGAGPAVLFFSDDVKHVIVDYKPSGAGDSFSGRVFTTSDKPLVFGDSVAFAKKYDADLPGVMAIQTNGTWSVTPTP